jgi:putative phage-type endonuclease
MSYVEVLTVDAPRDVWLAERRKGVGSSDIAVLLGLSTWDSPFGLYHRKTGALGEQEELERMYWGRKLEAVIADEFADRHPEYALARCGLVRSVERPWQQATPDRLIYDDYDNLSTIELLRQYPVSALEVKTDESMDGWGPDGTDEIPVKYRAQVLWQADCLDLPGVHVAALLPGKRYREYYVARDEGDLKLMREVAETFMDRVRDGDPPDVDGHPATIATLRALHPDVDDEEVEVPGRLAARWLAACKAHKRAEARKKEAEARLRQRMGRARWAVHHGEKVATRIVYDRKPYEVGPSTVDSLRPPRDGSNG